MSGVDQGKKRINNGAGKRNREEGSQASNMLWRVKAQDEKHKQASQMSPWASNDQGKVVSGPFLFPRRNGFKTRDWILPHE